MSQRQQFLRSTSINLEHTFEVDGTGTLADGAVTVTVYRADGTVLSTGAATSLGGGKYRYYIAPQANLNFLTVYWTGTFSGVVQTARDHAEIVGNFLFSESQARAFDSGLLDADYSDAKIADARTSITDSLEHYTGISWIPRFKRVTLDGRGTGRLQLPTFHPLRLLSVVDEGVTYATPSDIDLYDSGLTVRDSGWWGGDVTIEYEYGHLYPKDGVDRIALMWLRGELVHSNVSDRAVSYTDEMGQTYRFSEGPSGITEVDGWIERHAMALVG